MSGGIFDALLGGGAGSPNGSFGLLGLMGGQGAGPITPNPMMQAPEIPAGAQAVNLPMISADVPSAPAGFAGTGVPQAGATTIPGMPMAGGGGAPGGGPMTDAQALIASARRIGADPLDYATVMSYETGGTFSPSKWGGARNPDGSFRHMGLIQFGPDERKRYGASADQSFQEQLPAVERYLTARGFQPGMGRLDLYSTINAGRPGLYNKSDAGNGGAPGSVADKVRDQMGGHETKAAAFLGGDYQVQQRQAQPMQRMPGVADPIGMSAGATAQRGGFGLGGIEAQGAALPGQASTAPGLASLSAQPMTAFMSPTPGMGGIGGAGAPAATPQQPTPYGGVASMLRNVLGGQQGKGQQQGQAQGGRMAGLSADAPGGRAMSLGEAYKQFDPSQFFTMLRARGVMR
ncbi:hypothetical protein Q8W71_27340 [Methylobacterium sp. NEAU 140]|uniref:hypothetical protein n=1 Tax=Methylobacterium sp. NEAU 140 TaxID=3064945 RepID=UPI00273617B3|nr:hypothetical protein [Methylobacterium sp. NEAU 140]MDP4026343.1 hypothetical protein [Methylobacterium sp. NEAU 140]